nr:FliA/WhiG family RNA polymerase sigma factor [Prauserella isguenensis]
MRAADPPVDQHRCETRADEDVAAGGHHGNGDRRDDGAAPTVAAGGAPANPGSETVSTEAASNGAVPAGAPNTGAPDTSTSSDVAAAAGDGGGSSGGGRAEADAAIKALWHEFATEPSQRVRDRLVLHYAPLVKYVAGRVGTGLPTHVDVADLIQSGIFGLVDAIEKFDPGRGLRFETYAMQRIRGAILDDLRSQDWVPRVVRSRAREVERTLERLGARLGRTPTDAEVATELGISLNELHELYGQLRLTSVVALETLVAAGRDSESVVESLPDDDAVDPAAVLVDRDNREQLADAVAQLSERDRIVVSLYYFESLTLAEIGKVLGVTESRVSQLHTRAVLRLRAKLQEQTGS